MPYRKFSLLTVGLICFAGMSTAQGVQIDDDGWSRTEATAAGDFMVDVDDDGFARMDKPAKDMDGPVTTGTCSQIEMQMKMSGDECGKMSKAELSSSYIGAHD